MCMYQQFFTFMIICIPQRPERLLPFYSPTGDPISKNDTAKIVWIMLGVTVALSAVVVGIIVCRKRAKRNDKRYFIQMLISLKFRILFFVAELFHDKVSGHVYLVSYSLPSHK